MESSSSFSLADFLSLAAMALASNSLRASSLSNRAACMTGVLFIAPCSDFVISSNAHQMPSRGCWSGSSKSDEAFSRGKGSATACDRKSLSCATVFSLAGTLITSDNAATTFSRPLLTRALRTHKTSMFERWQKYYEIVSSFGFVVVRLTSADAD